MASVTLLGMNHCHICEKEEQKMKKASLALVFVLFLFVAASALEPIGAMTLDEETSARVPALEEFHTIICPMWHEYYPAKNYQMLRKILPDIERLAGKVYETKLPGILRHKQDSWNDGCAKLKKIIADYKSAADKNEEQKLLDSTEELHSQYERMVRIVRPAIKELDAFHVILYSIYHKYLPDFNLEELKKAVPQLAKSRDDLMGASLPKPARETAQYTQRLEAFSKTRIELSAAVDGLVKAMESGDKKTISEAIEEVHSKYQAVSAVFD
jgi:hypothetical protein